VAIRGRMLATLRFSDDAIHQTFNFICAGFRDTFSRTKETGVETKKFPVRIFVTWAVMTQAQRIPTDVLSYGGCAACLTQPALIHLPTLQRWCRTAFTGRITHHDINCRVDRVVGDCRV
jgi:hypothetical protein